jgi:NADH:ubiquinone oxidoreductase subunit 3 (subunit A)
MISDYGYVGLFLIFGIAFVASALIVSWLLRPRAANFVKSSPYECGELVKGTSWVQFNVHYYLIALIFVVFDVEVLFLVPWAIVLRELGTVAYVGMVVFIGILFFGLAYAWKKGAFNWQ